MSLDLSATATQLLSNLAISAASQQVGIISFSTTEDKLLGTVIEGAASTTWVNAAIQTFSDYERSLGIVQDGDRKITIDATQRPNLENRIDVMGEEMNILSIDTKLSGITPQVYVLHCRGNVS